MAYANYGYDKLGNLVGSDYDSEGKWIGPGPDPRLPRRWMDIEHSSVIAELVALAAERTKKKIEYREIPDYYRNGKRLGVLWSASHGYVGDFTAELDRLRAIVKEPLNEPILEDDYPVYQGRLYVANGKVREFIDGENMTVGRWKALRIRNVDPINEVRRCDIVGRQLRLPVKESKPASLTISSERHSGQRARRRRSSNKIRKVG